MTLLLKTFPVLELPQVFHVGTLNQADKGIQGNSQEGAGLSVSLHPEEWTQIARLGGNPTYELTKSDGRFLDRHHISLDTELRLKEWGIEQGWLLACTRWKAEWYDSEADCRVHFLMDTQEKAAAEVEDMEGADATVTAVDSVILTPAGIARLGFDNGPLLALDMAITFFAEDCMTVDGVWWEDTLDPMGLSAPRGVISTTKLPSWCVRKL